MAHVTGRRHWSRSVRWFRPGPPRRRSSASRDQLSHCRGVNALHDAVARRAGCNVPHQRSVLRIYRSFLRPVVGFRHRLALCDQLDAYIVRIFRRLLRLEILMLTVVRTGRSKSPLQV